MWVMILDTYSQTIQEEGEGQVFRAGGWKSLVPRLVRKWGNGLDAWRPRVLVAGDQETITHIQGLLGNEFCIIGRVDDGFDLLAAASEYSPDLIVTDLELPRLDGIEAAARLRRSGNWIPLVILTPHDAPELISEAMEAGADGYVLRCDSGDELVLAARAVSKGHLFISHSCHF